MQKKVTLKFKDAAEETRGIGALTLKLQSNDDPSYEKKKEIEVKAGETSKEIELKEGVEYNYEVEKTGYETTKMVGLRLRRRKRILTFCLQCQRLHFCRRQIQLV